MNNEWTARFDSFDSPWRRVAEYLKDQFVVTHNTSFDWLSVLDHVDRYDLTLPKM